MITPYHIYFADNAIEDLTSRLKNTRWPDQMTGPGWTYGPDVEYMKQVVTYWIDKYDWRKTEEDINSYPNYLFENGKTNVHFMHIRSVNKNAVPLIITHGWPGSFLEMMKLIPLLTNDFHLVIPSIPGFGLSVKPAVGTNVWVIADIWNDLMKAIGYEKYMAQGGDFGAGICTALALKHPEKVTCIHLNYIPGSYKPFLHKEEKLTEEEIKFEDDAQQWYLIEGAYSHLHRTRPLTVAYGLNDSPAGLCAWILEKFYVWSDCDGNVENVFSKDELLSNITLYWLTETMHSSIRLYNENSKAPMKFTEDDFVNVPVGIARFEKEEPFPPRRYIERGFNIQHWTDFKKGAHFAAMEQPEALASDIISFAKKIKA
jgi:pimeloyl-ACP methyl ester carboxylesterase